MVSSGRKPPGSGRPTFDEPELPGGAVPSGFDADDRTMVSEAPVFEDRPSRRPDSGGPTVGPAATSARGPTITRSRRPGGLQPTARPARTHAAPVPRDLQPAPRGHESPEARPAPGDLQPAPRGHESPEVRPAPREARDGARPRLRLPGVESAPSVDGVEPPSEGSVRSEAPLAMPPAEGSKAPLSVPLVHTAPPGSGANGFMAAVAVGVVVAVAAVFVRGTPSPERIRVEARQARPAGERVAPTRIHTWQDRYRAEHPELLVASPSLAGLPPRARGRDQISHQVSGPIPGHPVWTPDRVEGTPLEAFAPKPPGMDAPRYQGLEPGPPPPDMPSMVLIQSIPPGARVEVDGEVVGMTPFYRPGTEDAEGKRIRLSLPGYRAAEGRLKADGKGQYQLQLKLEPQ